MPENLQEKWINPTKSQSADLTHLMSNGYFMGMKVGINPDKFKKILARELEYNYQKYSVERITSPGFIAGKDTIPAFSSKAEDSYAQFQSVWLNILARYPNGIAHPYIGFAPGLTYSTIVFHEKNIVGNFGFEESGTDAGFSYQILFGADFDITSLISLGGGYKYNAAKPEMTWANGTFSEYDAGSHNFFIEVKVHF